MKGPTNVEIVDWVRSNDADNKQGYTFKEKKTHHGYRIMLVMSMIGVQHWNATICTVLNRPGQLRQCVWILVSHYFNMNGKWYLLDYVSVVLVNY